MVHLQLGAVAHACSPAILVVEAAECQAQDQLGLHSESLFKRKNKRTRN